MATDGSMATRVEEWMVTTAEALQHNDADLFNDCDIWRFQLSASKGGVESLSGRSPCFYAGHGDGPAMREGGQDLRRRHQFYVIIGVESRTDGGARIGEDDDPGTNKIEELVIAAFDKVHPGSGFDIDELKFGGTYIMAETARARVVQMDFYADRMI